MKLERTTGHAFRLLVLFALLGGCGGGQKKADDKGTPDEPAPASSPAEPAASEPAESAAPVPAPAGPAWKAPSGWFYKESFGKAAFVHMPVCVAADAERIVVIDSLGTETDKDTQVVIFGKDHKVRAKVPVPMGGTKMRSHGVAIAPDGAIYLALNAMDGGNQLAKVGRITGSGSSYSFEDLGAVSGAVAAYGIAVDAAGKVYLADAGTNKIFVDALGSATSFSGPGDTEDYPTRGIAVEPGGTLLTHTMRGGKFHLVRYSTSGQQLDDMELAKVAERLPWHYNEIAVAPDGRIFLADYGNRYTLRLSKDGRFDGKMACDNCRAPVGVAVAPDGAIYVADFRSKQVHYFEPMF